MIPFYLFGALAVIASLLVIVQHNPLHGVLLLILSFGALSGLYVLLDAPFVAVIQIIVYAGAIMVLFLFVVMLLNAPKEDTEEARLRGLVAPGITKVGALFALALVIELGWALTRTAGPSAFTGGPVTSVATIGRLLYTEYSFAFEAPSVLILVAMVRALVLARRDVRGTETK
jgi:NADH-quinone oxidoreductase subunit J